MATFTDTFDGATTDLTWVSARGSQRPTPNGDGTASIGGVDWQYARAEHNTGSSDMYAEVRVDANAAGEILLFVRGSNAGGSTADQTYFSAVLSLSERWCTFLEWAGPGPPVGGGPIGEADEDVTVPWPSVPFVFRFEAEGSTLRAYLDGQLIKTETRSGGASGTRGGLGIDADVAGSTSVRFGEYRVGALSDPPKPVVSAGADAALDLGDTFIRTATESGGAPTSRAWSIVSGPAQVGATLSTAAALTWAPTAVGTYVLRYTASNATGSASDTVTVTVTEPPPTTAAEAQGWGTPLPSSDEFDTPGIPDPTKWGVYGAGGTYGGDECWEGHDGNGRRCVDQVTVTPDGYLRITGTADGDTGAVSHIHDQQYGRWEVRARVHAAPGATGNPYHGVLIVWPRSNEWPIHGEYDFLEVDVGDQAANAWLHYPHPPLPGGDIEQEQATEPGVDVAEWHNYALEWTPTSLIGYLDGYEWFRFSGGAGPNGRGPIQGMPAGHLTMQLDSFFPEAGLQQGYLDVEWARIYPAPVPGPGVYVGEDVDEHRVKTVLTRTASELGTGITSRSWTVLSGPTSVGSVIGSTSTLTWTPTVPGEYRIEYRATNSAGSSADQLKVVVPPPPVHPAETTIDGGLLVEAAVSVHARAVHAAPGGVLAVGAEAEATYRVGVDLGGALSVTAGAGTVEQVRAAAGGTLAIDADATLARSATAAVGGALDVTAQLSAGQQVAATVGGDLAVYAVPGEAAESTLGGTLAVEAAVEQDRAATATADGQLTVVAHATAEYRDVGITLGGQLSVDADGRRAHPAEAGIDAALDVTADATRVKLGRARIDGRLTLSSDVTRVVHPTIDVRGSLAVHATTEVARGGALNLSVWAVDRQAGDRLVPLPNFVKTDVSDIANDAGAITLDYPAEGAGFDLLRRDVAHDSDLEVEIWLGGRRETAMRGYLDSASGDDVAEAGVWSFTGSLMPIRLAQTVIEPQAGDPKQEFRAAAATPGEMALLLFAQAQDRGALTDLTVDFTADRDSSGRPWPEVFTGKWSPGTTYLQWVQTLVELGLCETEVTADKVWRLQTFGHRGQDLSTGTFPVTLRRGLNLGEAGRRATVRDAGTDFFVAGGEGIYTRVGNTDARTRRGRAVEAYSSVGNVEDPDALTAAAQRTAAAHSTGPDERSFALALGTGHPRPGQSFAVGDTVRVDTDGQLGTERVAQWSLTATASGISGSAITGDLIRSRAAALLARITAAESGQIIVGTSDTGEDVGVPLAPTGVVAGSTAFVDHLDVYSSVTVGWLPVEHNTDGTAATDLDGYRCEYALASSPEEWQFGFDVGNGRNSASFTTLPGRIVYVRVLAYDRNGNRSEWSDVAEHVTEDDTTPPPNASAPACTNYLGTFKITWNGRSEAGTEMHAAAPDFSYVEVHLSTGSMFLPDDSTLVGRMYGPGDYVVTDLPYGVTHYARLVAVDIRGNRADPSEQGSAMPGKVVNVDLGEDAVDRAQIRSAAIGNAQIDNLAVNDAKIGNVSMGKVTAGQIKAAMIFTEGGVIGTRGPSGTGPGWDGDSAGIRFYNSAGTNTINFNAITGGALVTGEYRTAMTGERVIINPGGAAANEMRFYPSNNNYYGRLKTLTSVAIGYEGQAGMTMKGNSRRGDGQSGEVSVYPSYASLAWGNEMDGGAITSRISASLAENYIGGPQTRIVAPVAAAQTPWTGTLSVGSDLIAHDGTPWGSNPTVLTFTAGGNGTGSARIWQYQNNSGIQFDRGNGEGIISFIRVQGGLCRISSANWGLESSRALKQGIRRLRGGKGTEEFDPLEIVTRVRGRTYQKRGSPSGSREVGLIAEELPDLLRGPKRSPGDAGQDGEDGRGGTVDVYALITTLWEGLAQLKEQVDQLGKGQ